MVDGIVLEKAMCAMEELVSMQHATLIGSNSLGLEGVPEDPSNQKRTSIPYQPLHVVITKRSRILASHNLAELGMAPLSRCA